MRVGGDVMVARRRSRSSRRSRGSRTGRKRFGNVLGPGESFFTGSLKLHRFSDSLRITDMRNAGKRGKKVHDLVVVPKTRDGGAVLQQISEAILDMDYDRAKAYLASLSSDVELHETELRGVDVEPVSTTFRLSKTFDDGSIVGIDASPHRFQVTHSTLISAPGKAAHGYRQNTNYWQVRKKDAQLFYSWLKEHLHAAGQMTMQELRKLWDEIGVKFDSH